MRPPSKDDVEKLFPLIPDDLIGCCESGDSNVELEIRRSEITFKESVPTGAGAVSNTVGSSIDPPVITMFMDAGRAYACVLGIVALIVVGVLVNEPFEPN